MPRPLYLFEFCDQPWVPASMRECLFELMDFCNSGIRSFNSQVAEETLKMAKAGGYSEIVELGAGRAPVTKKLASDARTEGITLIPCDLIPNESVFRQLEKEYQGKVKPIYEPIDITHRHPELNNKVLVMAGMIHHIPFRDRARVLRSLSSSGSRCVIFEPLKRTWTAVILCTFAIFPALALPLVNLKKGGFLRRALWCWIIPVVPLMFVWDGMVSCFRQWTANEYLNILQGSDSEAVRIEVDDQPNYLALSWSGRSYTGGMPS